MSKMMKLFMVLGFLAAAVYFVPQVQADEPKPLEEIFEECGIGGMLFPSWPIGASVSNFTWDFGTTATTSGLTTPETCAGGQARMAAYINESYNSIENDLAKGDGKYLDMLATLAEKTPAEKEMFLSSLRSSFTDAIENVDYSSMTHFEKVELFYNLVQDLA